MKRSARGFEQIGHFFLSGSSSKGAETSSASLTTTSRRQADTIVAPESGKKPVRNMEGGGEVRADTRSADAPPIPRKGRHQTNRFVQASVCLGSTVAMLEILKRSCQGVTLAAESPSDRAVWFQGAGAIIQEAMTTLSEMIHPICSREPFIDERDEAGDGI